ncbi:hypothetical protein JYT51_00115 [Candidatus Amoebophilus asiaticus]|nr:hypothetical protein [Candidatus Amoebophilus asiaticus]
MKQNLSFLGITAIFIVTLFPGFIMDNSGIKNSEDNGTYRYERKYNMGNVYKYELTTNYEANDVWQYETKSISVHRVIFKDSIPYETITWQNLVKRTISDTVVLDTVAQGTTPHFISQHPEGKITIPKFKNPGMVGPIADLITFFVAISPHSGADRISRSGETFRDSETVIGNFADSVQTLLGEDCLLITQSITEIEEETIMYESKFLAPRKQCLVIAGDLPPISDTVPNNFQMIIRAGNNKVNVMWGIEEFTIKSTIRKSDGKIIHADMINDLNLMMKVNCDKSLTSCQTELPWKIRRNLSLDLIEE